MTENVYYPILNCRGVENINREHKKEQWAIVNEKNEILSQETHKSLEEIDSLITLDMLSFFAPGFSIEVLYIKEHEKSKMIKVKDGNEEIEAVDEGEAMSKYFTLFLSPKMPGTYRLVRLPDKIL